MNTGCRRRPSGNTRPGPPPPPCPPSATVCPPIRPTTMAIIPCPAVPRVKTEGIRSRLGIWGETCGGSTTCTATSWSGSKTTSIAATTKLGERRGMAPPGSIPPETAIGSIGAARGSTMPAWPGPPSATGDNRTMNTTISASGWSVRSRAVKPDPIAPLP
jgi:hypothetical protein